MCLRLFKCLGGGGDRRRTGAGEVGVGGGGKEISGIVSYVCVAEVCVYLLGKSVSVSCLYVCCGISV